MTTKTQEKYELWASRCNCKDFTDDDISLMPNCPSWSCPHGVLKILKEQEEELREALSCQDNQSPQDEATRLNQDRRFTEDKTPETSPSKRDRVDSLEDRGSTICYCGLDKERHKPCDNCGIIIHSCGMANNPCHYCHNQICRRRECLS